MTDSTWSDVVWRKSSRSNGGNACVEVAVKGDLVGVRDSKDPDGAVLVFSRQSWRSFVRWIVEDAPAVRPEA